MSGVFFGQIVLNAVAFSFLFWGLTFAAKYTYSNKFTAFKFNFYECGFKNLTKRSISYELNFILVLLFLLIYDGEFLILVPLCLNPSIVTFQICFWTIFFLGWLLLTLLFDYIYHALEWQI